LQERVGRIVAALPEAEGFALAGGAALVVTRLVDRATRDLDFFGPTADDVDRLLPAVESALVTAGLTVRRERVTHGFARLTVVAGDDVTELDLAADARIRRVDSGPLGPMLSVEELGADKLLALFDRAQAVTSSMSRRWSIGSVLNGCANWRARRTQGSPGRCSSRCSAASVASEPRSSRCRSRVCRPAR
jgi:hypothetical protein